MTILYLSDLRGAPEEDVGFKAKNLYRVIESGIRVPPGLVVTTSQFNRWLQREGLRHEIFRLARYLREDEANLAKVKEWLDRVFRKAQSMEVPDELIEGILEKLDDLSAKFIVVRPSPYAMGLKDGDLEGRTRVWFDRANKEGIKRALTNLWLEAFSLRLIARLIDLGIPPEDISIAAIIQKVIYPLSSGIAVCCPSRRAGEVLIESTWGLMAADSAKDRFKVLVEDMRVVESEVEEKRFRAVPTPQGIKREEVPQNLWVNSSLDEAKIIEITRTSVNLSKVFGTPTRVEWIVQDGTSDLYVIQAHKEPERPPVRAVEKRVLEFLSQPVQRLSREVEVNKEKAEVEKAKEVVVEEKHYRKPIVVSVVTGTRLFLRSSSPKNVDRFDGVITTLDKAPSIQGKEVIALLPRGVPFEENKISRSVYRSYAIIAETTDEIELYLSLLKGYGVKDLWAVMRNPGAAITLDWDKVILDVPSLIKPFSSEMGKVVYINRLLSSMKGKKFIVSVKHGPLTPKFIEAAIMEGAYGVAVGGKPSYYRQLIYKIEVRKLLEIP